MLVAQTQVNNSGILQSDMNAFRYNSETDSFSVISSVNSNVITFAGYSMGNKTDLYTLQNNTQNQTY